MRILDDIIASMEEAGSIAILPHVSADGDALGSSLALYLALKQMNKKAVIYMEEEVAMVYGFLPGVKDVVIYTDGLPEDSSLRYDMAIALDTGDRERLGERHRLFDRAGVTANIDHHPTNTEFAKQNYVRPDAAAVGEIVCQLIKRMGIKLDADISTCLYVAISTDTGGFRYSNTTAATHQYAGELIENGVNAGEVNQRIYESVSLGKVKLMGMAINSLEFYENNKIAVMTITDQMLKQAGAKDEDCDGLVNLGRDIHSVEVAVLLRKKGTNRIKVGLRSKTRVDVAFIAGLYGGGGHKRAAGCLVDKKIEGLKESLLEDIKEALKNSVIKY